MAVIKKEYNSQNQKKGLHNTRGENATQRIRFRCQRHPFVTLETDDDQVREERGRVDRGVCFCVLRNTLRT